MQEAIPKVTRPTPVPRSEDILAERYDRLCAWAVGLTRGDVNVALDIVHDLYLYVTLAKTDFTRVEHLDNYLYKCLRHIHLARLAEASRSASRQICVTELDSLPFALWASPQPYVLEQQNELRRICAYAVNRKEHSKSASFFVLRFFHGYRLQEIAAITNLSMSVLQPKLSRMRSEIQRYLEQPEQPHLDRASSAGPSWTAVSSQALFHELRSAIMHARTGDCLREQELLAHYRSSMPRPIACPLLSHIVSCEDCLSVIDRHFRRPTLRDREPMDGRPSTARNKPQKAGAAMSLLNHSEMLRIVRQHHRDLYDHRPQILSIAVDGKIVASHRVQGHTSIQSAHIDRPDQVGCVEVFSEMDVRLALVLIENLPPQGPFVKTEPIELSDGRWIEVQLVFDSLGLNCEITYFDPAQCAESAESIEADDGEGVAPALLKPARLIRDAAANAEPIEPGDLHAMDMEQRDDARSHPPAPGQSFSRLWSRLWVRVRCVPLLDMSPLLASALILAVASLACLLAWSNSRPTIMPAALLSQAERWDSADGGKTQSGVICQKVRISSHARTVERTIYRDAQGRRQAKRTLLNSEDQQLRDQLARAGVNWDRPLSAASYQQWRGSQAAEHDEVARAGQNRLRLSTTTPDSFVTKETLTVREKDFHPVSRTVELRDYGTVEIAELNYEVLPWEMADPDWFEPETVSHTIRAPRPEVPPALHTAPQLTEAELDEAELQARLVLNRLHLDLGRHIDVARNRDGIRVLGIVDTFDQKQQLRSQLSLVPHIVPVISTLQELDQSDTPKGLSGIQAESVVVSEPSSMERYLAETGMERSKALPLAHRVVDSAFDINHESKAINDLWQRFAGDQRLPSGARTALSELLIQHKAALLAALEDEQQQLIDLKLIASLQPTSEVTQGDPADLEAQAKNNVSLCVELTSPGAAQPRPAKEIAPELAQTVARLRATALRISAASMMSPPLNHAQADNQNQ